MFNRDQLLGIVEIMAQLNEQCRVCTEQLDGVLERLEAIQQGQALIDLHNRLALIEQNLNRTRLAS